MMQQLLHHDAATNTACRVWHHRGLNGDFLHTEVTNNVRFCCAFRRKNVNLQRKVAKTKQ